MTKHLIPHAAAPVAASSWGLSMATVDTVTSIMVAVVGTIAALYSMFCLYSQRKRDRLNDDK